MAQYAQGRRQGASPLTNAGPGELRETGPPARDTTVRQISERIARADRMVADGLAEIAALRALQAAMTSARLSSVAALSPEMQALHREAIRLASGASGGVEMW